MHHHEPASRREFLRRSALLAAASAAVPTSLAAALQDPPSKAGGSPPPTQKGKQDPVAIEHRVLGKTGLKVALLGFGGSEIGFERAEQAVVDRLLNLSLDAGLNLLDTAECYVDSEDLIGRAVGGRRKEYVLCTKVGHYAEPGESGWSKAAIARSLERSLKRLRTDCVDLVQLHLAPLAELRKGECIEALEEAKAAGKTRFLGFSGDGEAARYALETDRFDTLQTSVNIVDQEAIDLTLPLAKEKNVGVLTKRTIANAVWRHERQPEAGYHVEYWRRLQKLAYPFARGERRTATGPDGPAAVALRFVASLPEVSVMLVGTTKPERWRENAELLAAGPLPKAEFDAIRERWKEVAEPGWVGQG
jgi:aryl-alcohol dehydrogenase-like predicted oxidoreductase